MVTQPHEVLTGEGNRINWLNPPRPNTRCKWTKRTSRGRSIYASFRSLCHLNRLNNLALAKYKQEIIIIQPPFNTGVAASAGTHDFDAVWDLYIPGVSWWEQQRFFRANGFACWYRYPPLFGHHIHGFTLPPREGRVVNDDFAMAGFRVGKYVPGQLEDYYNKAFGLANRHRANSDTSWYPPNIEATIFNLETYIKRRQRDARKKP